MAEKLKYNKTNQYLINNIKEYFRRDSDIIIKKIENTPVPQFTLINFEKIISNINKYEIELTYIDYLIDIAAFSPFLSKIISNNPDYFLNFLFNNKNFKKNENMESYLNSLREFCANIKDIDKLKKFLRYFKQREFLKIGMQDISKIFTIDIITEQLSDLAAAFLQFSSEWLTEHKFKKVKLDNIFILGMGKLAGRELNFSSDIDLIYIYDFDNDIDVNVYKHFFQILTNLINDITEDGFVFRVDLRLRPEGENGPIAIDGESAVFYYENLGRFWERGVLLKAKPVAGNIVKGNNFLEYLSPFIYRRNLDFHVIDEIKSMKNKINLSIKQKEYETNIKLGFGGIREIEFIIQSIQLTFGGKYPEIREKNSIKFLNKINNGYDFLKSDEIVFLTEAYKFLRNLEHKIQILHQKQTHNLPKDENELKIIAFYFGFDENDKFISYQKKIRKRVDKIFNDFFELKGVSDKYIHKIVALTEQEDRERAIEIIEETGFENPEHIYNILLEFKYNVIEDIKESIMEIFSEIFNKIVMFNNKDEIVIKFVNLIDKIKYSKGYLNFLIKNKIAIESIMNLFCKSNYLSNLIIKYKELFEEIFFTDLFVKIKNSNQLKEELNIYIDKAMSYEDVIEQIRIFKHKENLRIGLHFLNEEIDVLTTINQLSDLANVIFEKSVQIVKNEFEKRYGKIDNRFTIIGLGKFGGEELNFSSDLDIVLLFESDVNYSEKGLRANEYYSRFLQRIISFLSVRTYNGLAYEIDTRLRPSGNSGALVTSFDAFKNYHNNSSAIWEIQALLKARIVGGDKDKFGKSIMEFIRNLIIEKEITEEDINEILRIRSRIEMEEGGENSEKIDIKNGAGGIIDIEFLTQILMLKNKIIENSNFRAIKILENRKLLHRKYSAKIYDSYKFLRKIENLIRLTEEKHNDKIFLKKIKNTVTEHYIDKILEVKKNNRKLFTQILQLIV